MIRFPMILGLVVAGSLTGCFGTVRCSAAESLTIGSKAPALDIAHWIQDGNGFFKPVTKFKDGKVYVVEFWATWCGPCVSSMPHLAELQEQYRGRDVQIISISTEPLRTIEPFLKTEHPSNGELLSDITSAYCLTSDPDESTYTDYMVAAKQNGIPMSFIVGKSGLVEWMGHPMLMDEPLEQIVEGSWDREPFRIAFQADQKAEEIGTKLSRLYSAGKIDEALAYLDQEIKTAEYAPLKENLTEVSYEIRFETNRIDADVFKVYRQKIKAAKTDSAVLQALATSTMTALENGAKLGGFVDEVVAAYESAISEKRVRSVLEAHQIVSMIHLRNDDVDKAIESLANAVEAASGSAKKRLKAQLNQLKETQEKATEKKGE